MVEEDTTWKQILKARYGDLQHSMMFGLDVKKTKKTSAWWKDVISASIIKTNYNCFAGGQLAKLGA